MKCWLSNAQHTQGLWILWRVEPNKATAVNDAILGLNEAEIRELGCTKRLPTGKQVIAVNLEMR